VNPQGFEPRTPRLRAECSRPVELWIRKMGTVGVSPFTAAIPRLISLAMAIEPLADVGQGNGIRTRDLPVDSGASTPLDHASNGRTWGN